MNMHSFIADWFACFDRLDPIEAHVRGDWRFKSRPKGRPLITRCSARLIEEVHS